MELLNIIIIIETGPFGCLRLLRMTYYKTTELHALISQNAYVNNFLFPKPFFKSAMSIQTLCSYIALFIYLWCAGKIHGFPMGITLHAEIHFKSLRLFFFLNPLFKLLLV